MIIVVKSAFKTYYVATGIRFNIGLRYNIRKYVKVIFVIAKFPTVEMQFVFRFVAVCYTVSFSSHTSNVAFST